VLREIDEPAPKPTEILVRVRAVSLNRRDALILDQQYPLPSVPRSSRSATAQATSSAARWTAC
jgi:NADPH:quinone reductase-like Zn-dependent oxidoreductase